MKIKRFDRETDDLESFARAVYELLMLNYRGQSPWSLNYILSNLADEAASYYFAFSEETAVAFMAVHQAMDELELANIAVSPDFQGQGIARQLLQQLEHFQGKLFLEVRASNSRAQQLYQRAGFSEYHRRLRYYTNPIEDAILMKKEQF